MAEIMTLKAIILAGGAGTRLRPLTNDTPKPMIAVCGKPIIEHIIDLLKLYNVNEILISVGFNKEKIMDYFGDGSLFGVDIKYIAEEKPMGTAGPLALAKKILKDTFIVSNGDNPMNVNISEIIDFHKKCRALCTIAINEVNNPSRYGVARLSGDKILEFLEKPKDPPSNLINSGFYIMEPGIIELIPENFCMLERDIFPKIAKMGKLFGFRFKGQWFDCGTIEGLKIANECWKGIQK